MNDSNEVRKLALRFNANPDDTEARDALVLAYMPLVKKLARRYASHPVDRSDLVQAGVIGLLQALPKYDPTRCTLGAYARKAVIGAIQDEAYRLYANAFGVPERQRGDGMLIRANGHALRLDVPLGPTAAKPEGPGGRPRTLGDVIPDGQQEGFAKASRMFDSQWKKLLHEDKVVDHVAALVRAFDWDTQLNERNVRIVVSYLRDVEVAMLLDGLEERRHLPPILTNRREALMTDYRFDGEKDAQGNTLVVTVAYDRPPVSPEQVEIDRQTLRRDSKTKGAVVAAGSRLGVWWDWPYPRSVAGIARALNLSRQAVYNIIKEYEQALDEICAEGKEG